MRKISKPALAIALLCITILAGYMLGGMSKKSRTSGGKPPNVPTLTPVVMPTPTPIPEPQIKTAPAVAKKYLEHGYQDKLVIDTTSESMFVDGRTKAELCESVKRYAREKATELGTREKATVPGVERLVLGYIKPKIDLSWETGETSKGYTMTSFKVTAKSTIVLPQWRSSGGASDSTKTAWRKFKNAVQDHEQGHQKILENNATRFMQALNNLGYYKNKGDVEKAVADIYRDTIATHNAEQDRYDDVATKNIIGILCD